MLIRYAALVSLSIFLLGTPPLWAEKLNYLGQIIDLTELIPPPPPSGSEEQTGSRRGSGNARKPHRNPGPACDRR